MCMSVVRIRFGGQPLCLHFVRGSVKKRLKSALKESTLASKLLCSNPLTPDLFDQEVVDLVISQADHQAKSVPLILGIHSQGQKRSASSSRSRTPKRQKGGHHQQQQRKGQQQQQQNPPRTPTRRGRSPSPGKRGGTPKGGNRSPRSQQGKGSGTPRKGGKGQSF